MDKRRPARAGLKKALTVEVLHGIKGVQGAVAEGGEVDEGE